MDVKSTFLKGILSDEAYVEQPKGCEAPKCPYNVYRLKKTLYKLKQSPKAWYERLPTYLLEKKIEICGVDRTLFINRSNDELLVVFRATSSDIALSFVEEMKIEFKMSMVGEFTFFLGL